MKKIMAIVVSLIFVFSLSAVSFAAEKAAAPEKTEVKKEATAGTKEAAVEKKAVRRAMVAGDVVAVDAKANTLTVKGPVKGDVALVADDKTMIMAGKDKKSLADIKKGDKVAARYIETDGKNTVRRINIKAAPAVKEQPKAQAKAEEKKETAPAKK